MILPSIELLEEVLGRKVKHGEKRIALNGNNLTFAYADEDMWSDINIYELASLVKEWAYEYGYIMDSNFAIKGNCFLKDGSGEGNYFYADTEPEAVFKAGEWVLKEIQK